MTVLDSRLALKDALSGLKISVMPTLTPLVRERQQQELAMISLGRKILLELAFVCELAKNMG